MSKKTIAIESEALDGIIRQTLVEDYRGLCEEVRRLENKRPVLKPYEEEDLRDSRRFRDGLEAILSYYLMADEARAIIDQEYIKSEYSYAEGAADAFAPSINPYEEDDDNEVEYHKDLKEKRIQMLEEQVEYLMNLVHTHDHPTFDGRKIHKDIWGKRFVLNANGIRTYLEPFED